MFSSSRQLNRRRRRQPRFRRLRTPGHGGAEAAATYRGIIDGSITKDPIPTEVVTLTGALYSFLKTSSMMAYLVMMIPRLVELRRVLKPTGSIYVHCDPKASHYLKLLMDGVFGAANFRNEIIWKRTAAHGRTKRWGPIHDTLLFYTVSDAYLWNRVFEDYDQSYVDDFYRFEDDHGRYRLVTLDGPGARSGSSGLPWRGVDPTDVRRHWEVPPDRALPAWFDHPPG